MITGSLAFLAGISLFQWLTDTPDPAWAWALLLVFPAVFALPRLRVPLLVVGGFLWALIHAGAILSSGLDAQLEGQDVTIEGMIASIPQQRELGLRFMLDVEHLAHQGQPHSAPTRVLLSWQGASVTPLVGERWRFVVRLKRPRGMMNPGGFDYERWLFQQQVRATGYVRIQEGPAAHQRLAAAGVTGWLDRWRQRLKADMDAALAGNAFTGIIVGLAIGDQQAVTERQWEVLRDTGTTHLMAISGLHVSMVAALAFFLATWLWRRVPGWPLRWPAQKAGAVAGIAAAIGYSALAGFSIPTQRTLIMLLVGFGAVIAQRRTHPAHLLAVALWLVLLWDPFAVLSAGFWLSFGAVAVLMYGMGGRLHPTGLWWKWGRVHYVVFIGLTPLLLMLFQQVAGLSPLANLVAVPYISLVVVPDILIGTALLPLWPQAGEGLLYLAAWLLDLLWPALEWLADMPGAQWMQHAPPVWTVACGVIGVVLLLAPRGAPGRWAGWLWLAPMALLPVVTPVAGEAWFTLLDVGQGLAAVVRTRDHALVYDTGPRYSAAFDTGGAVLVPYLRQSGVHSLDMLMVSHGDNDHAGGAASLLKALPAAQVLHSAPGAVDAPGSLPCERGQSWQWDGVAFEVLSPPGEGEQGIRSRRDNNQSCVLRISAPGGTILLTGDIEHSAENFLLDAEGARLASDILIVPHHGSKTSSGEEFVSAVSPRYALFPVGYRNRYGFPKPPVVERYQAAGAVMLSTERQGAVSFHIRPGEGLGTPEGYRQAGRRYWNSQ